MAGWRLTHLSGVVASLGSGTGYSSGALASALEGCFMDLLVGGTHMVRAARGGLPDARAGAGLAEALPGRVCAAAGRATTQLHVVPGCVFSLAPNADKLASFDYPEVESLLAWATTHLSHESRSRFRYLRFSKKNCLKHVSRAEFECASRRCFELFLGEPQSPLAVHITRKRHLRVSRCLLVPDWA